MNAFAPSTTKSMRMQAVGYWICTVLIAFSFLSGGVVDLLRPGFALEGMTHLGYPAYFMIILGCWKALGGGAILLPGFALIKEWEYAGMIFDLTGASASHFASGDRMFHIVTPLVLTALTVASWALRPEDRRLKRV
jgi:DoxX-like family